MPNISPRVFVLGHWQSAKKPGIWSIWRKKPLEVKFVSLASQPLLTQWPNSFQLECYPGWLTPLSRSSLELGSAVIWKDFYLISYGKKAVMPWEYRIEIMGLEKPHQCLTGNFWWLVSLWTATCYWNKWLYCLSVTCSFSLYPVRLIHPSYKITVRLSFLQSPA